ncbi:serine hydroxymethyltransferase [Caedimonas varicaedens]|jgi:glycine hydroxymethyltransferase|uniref:Serine hydroxymethyltransferase n=1 Tax=Caedimonas varicaedens TaxID=1629334 RepID=A0A0K8MF74_9PROT|nr:serine hydroxymethyltransferase [Caedimonas varicaedens]
MNNYLATVDPEIAAAKTSELHRQRSQLELIASENFTSLAVMEAQGSVLTNKYAEGYPGARYYGGCEFVDIAERLAIERACQLFDCAYANVQPHSGAQANQEVFYALLNPGDTFLGMSLDSGGHLTHGSKVNLSGKWFEAVGYNVDPETGLIDYDQVAHLAREYHPKLIIAGASAYPRVIDFAWFRALADEIGAYFMVDMAHFAGLVAGRVFPSPLPYAHVVTTTTHKTLRGPRGGMILAQTDTLAKRLNSAVFPGNQGGPLMHVIAGKAVAFKEALQEDFKLYAQQIIKNAKTLGDVIQNEGISLVSGGTDCHLLLVDLRSLGISGKEASDTLEQAGITCNKNSIPFDPLPPMKTSGIRLGSPAMTTRGLKEQEFQLIGEMIVRVLKSLAEGNAAPVVTEVRQKVNRLCDQFPLYPELAA